MGILLLFLFVSGASAAEIDGKVTAVAADTVTVRHASGLIPGIGDNVEISFTTPDGDVIPVGTWTVSRVDGNTVEAKVQESFGQPNVDMDARIFTEGRGPLAVLPVQPDVPNLSGDLTPEDCYQRGLDHRDQKDFGAAAQMFSRAAEAGHAGAQDALGWAYQHGQGVPQDYARALNWYQKAAQAEEANGQNNLGLMYLEGLGVKQNYAKAQQWFRKAADQNYAYGYWNLGRMAEHGWGSAKNLKKALTWYLQAAEQGLAAAQNQVGRFYQFGSGVKQDYAEAARWFLKAAEQNYGEAQNNLGLLYLNAWGVPLDYAEAVQWFQKAADNGYIHGHFNLGRLYENGWGVAVDYDRAMSHYNAFGDYVEEYKKGARDGVQEAITWLSNRGIAWDVAPPLEPAPPQPQRAGYEKQMQQEQEERNRKAAGDLLPALMELRNTMIKDMNQ